MGFKSWLFSLFQARRRPIRKAGRRRTQWNRVNLHLETLEDRLAPASIVTLVSFGIPGSDGAYTPYSGLVADSSGNLFGTTQGGGAFGTVYEVAHDTKTIKILAFFPYGGTPEGLVVDRNGNLFGITAQGGSHNLGAVYELAHNSHTITILGSFTGINGESPSGLVEDSKGNLFGTTEGGGVDDFGTVFEVAHNTHTITVLASFRGSVEQYPSGLVVDSSGNLFGVTQQGGAGGTGSVFELTHNSHTITTLASFASTGSNGEFPQGGLVEDRSGNLFGTTSFGGAGGTGTVFELTHNSHTITTLASFESTGNNGNDPQWNLLEDSAGNLFGITFEGGEGGYGTVFEVAHNSSAITNLGSFTGSNGEYPLTGLVVDSSGDLFGSTYGGGAGGGGTLFEVPQSATITTSTTTTVGAGPHGRGNAA